MCVMHDALMHEVWKERNSTSAALFWTRRSPRPGVLEYWALVDHLLADLPRVFCV